MVIERNSYRQGDHGSDHHNGHHTSKPDMPAMDGMPGMPGMPDLDLSGLMSMVEGMQGMPGMEDAMAKINQAQEMMAKAGDIASMLENPEAMANVEAMIAEIPGGLNC